MKKFKVLYNTCFGGFEISQNAINELEVKYNIKTNMYGDGLTRHDYRLIELFEKYGSEWISGETAKIEIIECESDGYSIDDYYDGKEKVIERYVDFVLV